MNVDEQPTPRESGARGRVDLWLIIADRLVCDLLAEAERCARVRSTDIARGADCRMLARRVREVQSCFEAWIRGEATPEQQEADLAKWRDVQAAARELGVR